MPLLSKRQQVAVVKETVGGTVASDAALQTAGNADLLILDSGVTIDVEQVERDLKRESLTSVKSSPGQKAGEITISTELAGTSLGTHAAGAPPWGLLMEACGMEQIEVQAIQIGAITTGPFQHGEIITSDDTNSPTARVIMSTHNGASEVLVDKASVTDSGSITATAVWTGGSSAAVATASTIPVDEGFAWAPISNVVKELDVSAAAWGEFTKGSLLEGATSSARAIVETTMTADGKLYYYPVRGTFTATESLTVLFDADTGTGDPTTPTVDSPTGEAFYQWPTASLRRYLDGTAVTLAGCRGSFTLTGEVNRPWRLDFSMRGSLSATTDAALIAGVSADSPALPPLWNGSAIGYVENEDATSDNEDVSGELVPCLTALSFDMGVQLADRRCVNATTGLVEVLGADREASGSMDPEVTLEADIPWLARVQDGVTARLRVPVGSADGNQFTLFAEGLQIQSPSGSDRDGIATYDVGFALTGGYHHNLTGAGTLLDAYGGDNELVIVYHTS